MFNLSTSISLIAFVVAVITPAVTTYLNNRFQLKLKRLELRHSDEYTRYEKKQVAYSKFLEAAASIIKRHTAIQDFIQYSITYHEIFLYAPSTVLSDLELFDFKIHTDIDEEEARSILLKITKSLSADLDKCMPVSR